MQRMKCKAIAKRNPQQPDEAAKYYLSVVRSGNVDIEQLAVEVSNRCSLRESDVRGALIALMSIIPEQICAGKVVSMGKLGSFYVNVSSNGVETPDEVGPSIVRGFKVIHQPTKEFKKHLRLIDVTVQSAS